MASKYEAGEQEKKISHQSNKLGILSWGWGFLLLVELFLGEFLVFSEKNQILLIIGLITLLFGIFLIPVPFILFPKEGKIPKGKKFIETTELVNSGIYGMVRHPQYLGWALVSLSLVLIRQHYIIVTVGGICIILIYVSMIEEEKEMIIKFGEKYQEYMTKVPRWNLFFEIIKRLVL